MKQSIFFLLTFCFLLFWSSCRNDFEFAASEGTLRFSKDTVYLDTVFTNIGSSTYTLKVYNTSDDNILIPKIKLKNGPNSNYRLNVDGMTGDIHLSGNEFTDVELLAKDSMYIFIETTIDIQDLVSNDVQYLYTDAIEFGQTNLQTVELVTLVKDAVFIYPQQITDSDGTTVIETLNFDLDGDGVSDATNLQGRFLENDELTFTNEKPYVIYGFAAIGDGQTLTIDAGARLHFHSNSGLLVTNNASIHANGLPSLDTDEMENEIILEGHRLEPGFSDVPGQWETIWLYSGSTDNKFNHTTIKNSKVGILTDGNQDDFSKLLITNTQIYNASLYGILARATNIKAENLVINNTGFSSFAATFGGNYDVVHATIANYWTNGFRQLPALLLNNFTIDANENTIPNALVSANFTNCIIYGNDNPELILEKISQAGFDINFKNCLLRFSDPNNIFTSPYYNFQDPTLYENMIFNANPFFLDPSANKMEIPLYSPAAGAGRNAGSLSTDLKGTPRSSPADLGALNAIEFEN